MESFVLEKLAALRQEYDWIDTFLKALASAYVGLRLEQTLAKIRSIHDTKRRQFP